MRTGLRISLRDEIRKVVVDCSCVFSDYTSSKPSPNLTEDRNYFFLPFAELRWRLRVLAVESV
jgi:hypothetical protein